MILTRSKEIEADGAPPPPSSREAWSWALTALALPLVVFLVLQPGRYDRIPNGLDPVFYTGYALNLDDLIAGVGDRHYFVSRWSAYLPVNYLGRLLGFEWARLVVRWMMVSGAVCAIASLPTARRVGRTTTIAMAIMVISMPMFVRALMTDYVEYVVVGLGLSLMALCVHGKHSLPIAAAVGVIAGLMIVANPVASTVVGISILAGLFAGFESVRRSLIFVLVVAVSVASVILGGWILFRWRYAIDVYRPTLEFIRDFEPPVVDEWRSPRLEWLGRFTWLYAPPIVLGAGLLVLRVRGERLTRPEVSAVGAAAGQYAWQWFDQFGRAGYGLELAFYWSFVIPSFLIAFAIIGIRLVGPLSRRSGALLSLGWLAALLVGVPDVAQLRPGFPFVLIVVAVGAIVTVTAHRSVVPFVAVAGIVAATQIGAPAYDPSSYWPLNSSPFYDKLFHHDGAAGERDLGELLWMEKQLDRVANDHVLSFLPTNSVASALTGIYSPHPLGRILGIDFETLEVSSEAAWEVRAGRRPSVALLGLPHEVAQVEANLRSIRQPTGVQLDVTHNSDLGYRIVVFSMPDADDLPFTWSGSGLLTTVAEPRSADGESILLDDREPGVVTFGPYEELSSGRYVARLRYRASALTGRTIGEFDAFSLASGTIARVGLLGTAGELHTADITFDVAVDQATDLWEFRTYWDGVGLLTVESVTLMHS